MKSISLLIVVMLFLGLAGCSDRQSEEEYGSALMKPKLAPEKPAEPILELAPLSFVLKDVDERDLNITCEDGAVLTPAIEQPLVLLNFFATWCPPCQGELHDLDQLQRKYADKLFVVGILVNDEHNSSKVRDFMQKQGAHYFISHVPDNGRLASRIVKRLGIPENYPIPLTVLYKNGKLYRHYEGAMPIEMMENEIRGALGQL